MIFLSFRVPMSKFGAKVELRCNDGKLNLNDLSIPLMTLVISANLM